MKTPLRMIQKYKYLAIAISVVAGGLWLALVLYTIATDRAKTPIAPGAVTISSHYSGTNAPIVSYKEPRAASSSLMHHSSTVTPSMSATTPQATMGSTSMHIHQTSSATAQHIGSGWGASVGGNVSNGNSASRGIHSTALAYSGTIYIPTVSNAITAVGAKNADELVNQKMGLIERRRIKKEEGDGFGDLNDGPVLDPPPPTPLGDVAWGLMILLAVAYATMRGVRRVRREEK